MTGTMATSPKRVHSFQGQVQRAWEKLTVGPAPMSIARPEGGILKSGLWSELTNTACVLCWAWGRSAYCLGQREGYKKRRAAKVDGFQKGIA